MTLCVIVSACGAVEDAIKPIFDNARSLTKRCSKIGKGDVTVYCQDFEGQWAKCEDGNFYNDNSMKRIRSWFTGQQHLCHTQSIRSSKSPSRTPSKSPSHSSHLSQSPQLRTIKQINNNISLITQLQSCIKRSKKYHEQLNKISNLSSNSSSNSSFTQHILLICHENSLLFNFRCCFLKVIKSYH